MRIFALTCLAGTAKSANSPVATCLHSLGPLASFGMPSAEVLQVCHGANSETVACSNSVIQMTWDRDLAVALCSGGGTMATVMCYSDATMNLRYNRADAVALCINGGSRETVVCASKIQETCLWPITGQMNRWYDNRLFDAIRLCRRGDGPERIDCVNAPTIGATFSVVSTPAKN